MQLSYERQHKHLQNDSVGVGVEVVGDGAGRERRDTGGVFFDTTVVVLCQGVVLEADDGGGANPKSVVVLVVVELPLGLVLPGTVDATLEEEGGAGLEFGAFVEDGLQGKGVVVLGVGLAEAHGDGRVVEQQELRELAPGGLVDELEARLQNLAVGGLAGGRQGPVGVAQKELALWRQRDDAALAVDRDDAGRREEPHRRRVQLVRHVVRRELDDGARAVAGPRVHGQCDARVDVADRQLPVLVRRARRPRLRPAPARHAVAVGMCGSRRPRPPPLPRGHRLRHAQKLRLGRGRRRSLVGVVGGVFSRGAAGGRRHGGRRVINIFVVVAGAPGVRSSAGGGCLRHTTTPRRRRPRSAFVGSAGGAVQVGEAVAALP
mmetsp:Transcript_2532/g.7538  ORF Transcript_2532/g.7538 Transcript_2532/m.7538 type:complete len:376 (-) Transcript_2532:66-1193(-)